MEKNKPPQARCLQGLCYLFPTSLEGRTGKGILLHGDLLAIDNVDAGNELEGHGLASLHELGCDCCACCGEHAHGLCLIGSEGDLAVTALCAEALAAGGYAR